ncbi:polysaccharide biosynthesis/export family protein [Crocinitomicaceae bacterium]|nr:polysaccharide biosynthesis/export family protein [Crocinitomicaceae bacterium]
MKRTSTVTALLVALLPCSSSQSFFRPPETVIVPADRLIDNLEKRLAAKPAESALIRPGEQIKIWTWKNKHLDGFYMVDKEGLIKLPRIGPFKVSGKTLRQVNKELNSAANTGSRGVFAEQGWGWRKGRLMPGETARLHYELARLHAMRHSLKIEEFVALADARSPTPTASTDEEVNPFAPGREAADLGPFSRPAITGNERPYFGHEPHNRFPPNFVRHWRFDGIPRRRREQYDRPSEEEAQKHLAAAIKHYREALKLNTNHLPARLGLGWCLEQAGDKTTAVESYRKALALAWKKEGNEDYLLYDSFVQETTHYLLPLLDPEKDAQEIEKIKGYAEAMRKKSRAITPLVVPLEDDAMLAELVDYDASVRFDLDASGFQRRWGWITPEATWLVWDPHGSGKVTSGLQMFGSVTFWIFWKNGYEALSALDDNGDGCLSGHELRGLALWHDRNSNGLSDPGEVQSVESCGVQSLSCHYCRHPTGIVFSPRGVVFQGGRSRPTYDWIAPSG